MVRRAPADITTKRGIVVPARALSWHFSRSGGPGGQHANTSDTRVELVCSTGLLAGDSQLLQGVRERLGTKTRVVASAERSQAANRQLALERLVKRLDAAARRPRPRHPTRPTRSSMEARLESKHLQSRRKQARRPPDEE